MPTLGVALDSRKAVRDGNAFTKSLSRMRDGAKRADNRLSALEGAMKRTGKMGVSLRRRMIGLAAAFGGLMIVRKAVKVIADFEFTMAKLKGVTGATEQQFVRLERTARRLGASTKYAASEVGEGLLFLARAGFTVEESIAAISATLDLATVGVLELGEAADIASNVLSQFGLRAEKTERVVDALVNTANRANTDVRQLAEAMKMAGPIAGSLGITIEETAAAVGVLGDSGIHATLAGTQLRGAFSALLGPTDKAKRALEQLGLSLEEVNPAKYNLFQIFSKFKQAFAGLDSATDAAGLALKIFGRRQAAGALILARGADKIRELTRHTKEHTGAAKEQAKVMKDTLAGSFKQLSSAIEEAALQAGDRGLGGALKNIVDSVTWIVRGIDALDDTLQSSIFFWIRLWTEFKFAFLGMFDVIEDGWDELHRTIATGAATVINLLTPITGIEAVLDVSPAINRVTRRTMELEAALFAINQRQTDLYRKKYLLPPLRPVGEVKALREVWTAMGLPAAAPPRPAPPRRYPQEPSVKEALKAAMKVAAAEKLVGEALKSTSETLDELVTKERERTFLLGLSKKARAELEMYLSAIENVNEAVKALGLDEAAAGKLRAKMLKDNAGRIEELISLKEKNAKIEASAAEAARIAAERQEQAEKLAHARLRKQQEQAAKLRRIAEGVGDAFARAFEDAVFGAKSLSQAVRALARDISKLLMRKLVTEPLAGAIANAITGLVTPTYTGEAVQRALGAKTEAVGAVGGGAGGEMSMLGLQRGGVISEPAAFRTMSGRSGVMGEAGAEAIIPLTRTRGGKLGVTAAGAGGGDVIRVTMNVNGVRDVAGFRRNQRQLVASFSDELEARRRR